LITIKLTTPKLIGTGVSKCSSKLGSLEGNVWISKTDPKTLSASSLIVWELDRLDFATLLDHLGGALNLGD
jgi:hypothetical protein